MRVAILASLTTAGGCAAPSAAPPRDDEAMAIARDGQRLFAPDTSAAHAPLTAVGPAEPEAIPAGGRQ